MYRTIVSLVRMSGHQMLQSLWTRGRNSAVIALSMKQWVGAVSPDDSGSIDVLLTAIKYAGREPLSLQTKETMQTKATTEVGGSERVSF